MAEWSQKMFADAKGFHEASGDRSGHNRHIDPLPSEPRCRVPTLYRLPLIRVDERREANSC
jgi:hypothetical protein